MTSLDGAPPHEHFGLTNLPVVLSRAWLAVCHAELSTFAEGVVPGEAGLQMAEAVALPGSLMRAYHGLGLLALRQGDLPRAIPRLERAIGICQDADLPAWFPWMAATLGAAYTLSGRLADAVPLLVQAMEQTTVTAMARHQALCGLALSEAQIPAGRLEEAHARAERAPAHARVHQERGYQAYALRLLGEIVVRHQPPRAIRPTTTTARPSPWPTNLVCARSRPTVTSALVRCMRRLAFGSELVPNCAPPSSCTGTCT